MFKTQGQYKLQIQNEKYFSVINNDGENTSEEINNFCSKNKGKKIVVVQGLGFVGSVMALVVANAHSADYAVIGVDLPNQQNLKKIQQLNAGVFPIKSSDSKVEEFYRKSIGKGNFLATTDPFAYSKADVIIIDINLDVTKEADFKSRLENYSVNLQPFIDAVQTIGNKCKSNVLILVETTVPPGTCQKVIKPTLDDIFKKRGMIPDYKLCHSYERVMPGSNYIDSIQNFYRVYAGINEESADEVEKFFRTIIYTDKYPLTRLNSVTASEMAKVLENSFRAMNIAFVQEWTEFAHEAGVNLFKVIDAIRMRPTHLNLMFPGLGVGGYCLTKDPLLASWARQHLFQSTKLPQSETAVMINDLMPIYSFDRIHNFFGGDLKNKWVLLLGVSYLGNVGDTRYTPTELLYDLLYEVGCEITLHDPFVELWTEKELKVETDLLTAFKKQIDIAIFCTSHDYYKRSQLMIQYFAEHPHVLVVDTNRVLSEKEIEEIGKTNKVIVIGRGDL